MTSQSETCRLQSPPPSIFPNLPVAMLPLPPPPADASRSPSDSSSPHSSRKRKRARELASVPDDDSISSRNPTFQSSAYMSAFSAAVREKVLRLDHGETCWHCGASPTDICHVIGRRNSEFTALSQQGLLTFQQLGDAANAIPLCPLCHRNFDDLVNPGFVFIPTDLEYFIEFEKADQQRRRDIAAGTATVPTRVAPTSELYRQHQLSTGTIQPDACGGLYLRYTLRDYFPNLGQPRFVPGLGPFSAPTPWHGAPMAALQRAFVVLGKPLARGIPKSTKTALLTLVELYGDTLQDEPETSSRPTTRPSTAHTSSDEDESCFLPKTLNQRHVQPRNQALASISNAQEPSPTIATTTGRQEPPEPPSSSSSAHCRHLHLSSPPPSHYHNFQPAMPSNGVKTSSLPSPHSQPRTKSSSEIELWGPYATSQDAVNFFTRIWRLSSHVP